MDFLLEPFRDFADAWYYLTWWIQDPLAGFWRTLVSTPFIGTILAFWEATFGRGLTL